MLFTCPVWMEDEIRRQYPGIEIVHVSWGKAQSPFAPSYRATTGLRQRKLTWSQFEKQYTQEMRDKYRSSPQPFQELAQKAKDHDVAMLCYEDANEQTVQCHRRVLSGILSKLGAPVGDSSALRMKMSQVMLGEKEITYKGTLANIFKQVPLTYEQEQHLIRGLNNITESRMPTTMGLVGAVKDLKREELDALRAVVRSNIPEAREVRDKLVLHFMNYGVQIAQKEAERGRINPDMLQEIMVGVIEGVNTITVNKSWGPQSAYKHILSRVRARITSSQRAAKRQLELESYEERLEAGIRDPGVRDAYALDDTEIDKLLNRGVLREVTEIDPLTGMTQKVIEMRPTGDVPSLRPTPHWTREVWRGVSPIDPITQPMLREIEQYKMKREYYGKYLTKEEKTTLGESYIGSMPRPHPAKLTRRAQPVEPITYAQARGLGEKALRMGGVLGSLEVSQLRTLGEPYALEYELYKPSIVERVSAPGRPGKQLAVDVMAAMAHPGVQEYVFQQAISAVEEGGRLSEEEFWPKVGDTYTALMLHYAGEPSEKGGIVEKLMGHTLGASSEETANLFKQAEAFTEVGTLVAELESQRYVTKPGAARGKLIGLKGQISGIARQVRGREDITLGRDVTRRRREILRRAYEGHSYKRIKDWEETQARLPLVRPLPQEPAGRPVARPYAIPSGLMARGIVVGSGGTPHMEVGIEGKRPAMIAPRALLGMLGRGQVSVASELLAQFAKNLIPFDPETAGALGKFFEGYQHGGSVDDEVIIRAHRGEYVLSKEHVAQLGGIGNVKKLFPPGGGIRGYQGGGEVGRHGEELYKFWEGMGVPQRAIEIYKEYSPRGAAIPESWSDPETVEFWGDKAAETIERLWPERPVQPHATLEENRVFGEALRELWGRGEEGYRSALRARQYQVAASFSEHRGMTSWAETSYGGQATEKYGAGELQRRMGAARGITPIGTAGTEFRAQRLARGQEELTGMETRSATRIAAREAAMRGELSTAELQATQRGGAAPPPSGPPPSAPPAAPPGEPPDDDEGQALAASVRGALGLSKRPGDIELANWWREANRMIGQEVSRRMKPSVPYLEAGEEGRARFVAAEERYTGVSDVARGVIEEQVEEVLAARGVTEKEMGGAKYGLRGITRGMAISLTPEQRIAATLGYAEAGTRLGQESLEQILSTRGGFVPELGAGLVGGGGRGGGISMPLEETADALKNLKEQADKLAPSFREVEKQITTFSKVAMTQAEAIPDATKRAEFLAQQQAQVGVYARPFQQQLTQMQRTQAALGPMVPPQLAGTLGGMGLGEGMGQLDVASLQAAAQAGIPPGGPDRAGQMDRMFGGLGKLGMGMFYGRRLWSLTGGLATQMMGEYAGQEQAMGQAAFALGGPGEVAEPYRGIATYQAQMARARAQVGAGTWAGLGGLLGGAPQISRGAGAAIGGGLLGGGIAGLGALGAKMFIPAAAGVGALPIALGGAALLGGYSYLRSQATAPEYELQQGTGWDRARSIIGAGALGAAGGTSIAGAAAGAVRGMRERYQAIQEYTPTEGDLYISRMDAVIENLDIRTLTPEAQANLIRGLAGVTGMGMAEFETAAGRGTLREFMEQTERLHLSPEAMLSRYSQIGGAMGQTGLSERLVRRLTPMTEYGMREYYAGATAIGTEGQWGGMAPRSMEAMAAQLGPMPYFQRQRTVQQMFGTTPYDWSDIMRRQELPQQALYEEGGLPAGMTETWGIQAEMRGRRQERTIGRAMEDIGELEKARGLNREIYDIQTEMRQVGYDLRIKSFDLQKQQAEHELKWFGTAFEMQQKHFTESWALQKEIFELRADWREDDFARQQSQAEERMSWTREDLAYRKETFEMQAGWRQKDFVRGQARAETQMGWVRQDLEYRKETFELKNKWQLESFDRDSGHAAISMSWLRQDFEYRKKVFEIRSGYQTETFDRESEHAEIRMDWLRQSMAFQKDLFELQAGWQQEDFDTAIRFATGRQKRQLRIRQERATIETSMRRMQMEEERKQAEERYGWSQEERELSREIQMELIGLQRERLEEERKQAEERFAWAEEEREISRAQYEEMAGLQRERLEEERKQAEERFAWAEADRKQARERHVELIEMQREQMVREEERAERQFEWAEEQRKLDRERNEESTALAREQMELQREQFEEMTAWQEEERTERRKLMEERLALMGEEEGAYRTIFDLEEMLRKLQHERQQEQLMLQIRRKLQDVMYYGWVYVQESKLIAIEQSRAKAWGLYNLARVVGLNELKSKNKEVYDAIKGNISRVATEYGVFIAGAKNQTLGLASTWNAVFDHLMEVRSIHQEMIRDAESFGAPTATVSSQSDEEMLRTLKSIDRKSGPQYVFHITGANADEVADKVGVVLSGRGLSLYDMAYAE